MIFTILTAILSIAILVVGAVKLIMLYRANVKQPQKKLVPSLLCVCGALCLFIVPSSFHTVDTGEIAVVKDLGIIKKTEEPGTYFDFRLTRTVEIYDSKVQQQVIKTAAYTSDAQPMDIVLTVQFQIRQDQVENIAKTYGGLETLANKIQAVAIERTKAVLSGYKAEELIEQRSIISPEVERSISDAIGEKYYVTFNSAVLTDIDFSDAFEQAVESKMKAQQEKLQAEYENEKAREKAEAELYVAEQEAKAALARAQAEADSKVALSKAEAESIMLKSVEIARMLGYEVTEKTVGETTTYEITFTSEKDGKDIADYMKYIEYLSVWDGKLPEVVSDGTGIMITVPQSGNE